MSSGGKRGRVCILPRDTNPDSTLTLLNYAYIKYKLILISQVMELNERGNRNWVGGGHYSQLFSIWTFLSAFNNDRGELAEKNWTLP